MHFSLCIFGPVICSGQGTARVGGRACIRKAGTVVIMFRIIVEFPKLVFQVLEAVRLEVGVGGPGPGVLVSLCGLHHDRLSPILGRVVFIIIIFGVNSRISCWLARGVDC